MRKYWQMIYLVYIALLATGCQQLPASGTVPPLNLALYSSPTPTLTPTTTPTSTPWPTVYITAVPTPTPTPALEETAAPDPTSLDWARKASILNPPALAWEELVANAQAEGAVTLYTDSGRAMTALDDLTRSVGGLTAAGTVADGIDIFLQLTQDIAAESPQADVVLTSDGMRTWNLTQQNRLWTYMPPDLAELLTAAEYEGLLAHHWTGVTWVYNPRLGEPAITSWWDLTEPAWSGRVVLADPRASERTYNVLAALDQQAAQLALDYYNKYGKLLVLDKDCPNAACQWFKLLLANQPILLSGESEVAQAVGSESVSTSLVGLCGLDILARVGSAPSVYPLPAMQPFVGWLERSYISIADQAPHPEAAKLAIRWLLGDSPCERGWKTWCLAGFYSYNKDIPDPEGLPSSRELLPRLIDLSPRYAYEHQVDIEGWITLQLIDRPLQYAAPQ
ncbi:MAG: ABC transporter substrate-binding protein [Chloroflexi bacterium]|nr:ABC transporter substrate-binding protein [Chloroflexota bacterium]